MLLKAGVAYDQGKYPESEALYRRFVDAKPRELALVLVAQEGIGLCAEARGDFAAAQAAFTASTWATCSKSARSGTKPASTPSRATKQRLSRYTKRCSRRAIPRVRCVTTFRTGCRSWSSDAATYPPWAFATCVCAGLRRSWTGAASVESGRCKSRVRRLWRRRRWCGCAGQDRLSTSRHFCLQPAGVCHRGSEPGWSDGLCRFVRKRLHALRYRDGEVLWQRPFKGGLASEPLYVPAGEAHPEPLLLVGDDDGSLTALAPRRAKCAGRPSCRGRFARCRQYLVDWFYTTTTSGRIYAHKLDTGKWVWQYERETPRWLCNSRRIGRAGFWRACLRRFPDGYLGCLRAENGEVLWTRQLSGNATRFTDVDSTPVLVGDTLYVSCYSSGVFALDVKDGSTRWRYDLDAAGQLAADPQGERIYASSSTQGLVALDRKGRLCGSLVHRSKARFRHRSHGVAMCCLTPYRAVF